MNNHMDIPWHEYTNKDSKVKIENASLTEKSSVIGRIGLMELTLTPNPCLYIIQVSTHLNLLVWKTLSITLKTNVKHAHAMRFTIN